MKLFTYYAGLARWKADTEAVFQTLGGYNLYYNSSEPHLSLKQTVTSLNTIDISV